VSEVLRRGDLEKLRPRRLAVACKEVLSCVSWSQGGGLYGKMTVGRYVLAHVRYKEPWCIMVRHAFYKQYSAA
jgi:hypothetical protein